jgi:L-serine dehydratase
MAAGGIVYLKGGTPNCILNAVAYALQNLLGLVCDPVAGLVEVPCVMRNVIGAVNALTSADIALAGIQSIIPADEVIDAMRRVGEAMPKCLRETGEGGIAATPTGIQIRNQILNNK